jgi:hypothetical protein
MQLDLPDFVDKMARASAAAEYTDLVTYIMLLIIRDDKRRLEEAARAAAARHRADLSRLGGPLAIRAGRTPTARAARPPARFLKYTSFRPVQHTGRAHR